MSGAGLVATRVPPKSAGSAPAPLITGAADIRRSALRILYAEDSREDAELVRWELHRAGLLCDCHCVELETDFRRELAQFHPQVILADFTMPCFSGGEALRIAREVAADVPFIFVSGTMPENPAVDALQAGAADHVLKGNLVRLAPAIRRALADADARAGQRSAETRMHDSELRFQATFDQAAVGIAHVDEAGCFLLANQRLADMLGYAPGELAGMDIGRLSHPEDIDATTDLRGELHAGRIATFTADKRYLHKDGRTVWMRLTVALMRGPAGEALCEVAVFEDITERKRANQILHIEHTVARCLADADQAGTALTTIIRAICDSEGWDLGRYFRLDEAACVMRMDTSWGKPGEQIERFLTEVPDLFFRPSEGLVGAAWHASEPLWVADASADARVKQKDLARATGMHAAFVFPVRAGGNTVGVLAFWSHQIQAPDARLLQAVRVIGGQIGQFMVRDAQQRHIARLNRIHVVLSGINQLIVRARSRTELFREACRIAVEDGHFALAWLGMVDRQQMQLKIVASHDTTKGYVGLIPLGLDEFTPGGLGLAGRAVWERHAIIVNDIAGGSQLHILKDEALARGLRSMVALPLKVGNEVIGVLSLYANTPNFFDSGEMKLLLELAGDIAFALDHLDQADRLERLAYYDPLTGLANRRLFEERLGQMVSETGREGARLAVLMYDVVRFKTINDTFGRRAGDELLKQIVERAAGDTPVADRKWMARVGGDHFVSFIPGVDSEGDVGRRLEARLQKVMGAPFRVGDADLHITVKVGIAIYPEDGRDADTLLKNAEVALKRAKQGRETYLFFNPAMSARVAEKLMLENQLRQALEKEEFVLHYQPKLDLDTGKIVGAEALIRWQSPTLGLVPPLRFVPLLEETGMILEVGRWALRQAVLDHGRLEVRGLNPPRIAVNVSPLQLARADFVDTLRTVLAHGPGLPAIDLEITESVVMDDVAGNIAKLKEIRELGVDVAIDDFGTGYSSLAYLARLPVQVLKIDRSFIITMLAEPDTMTLVATMISLAHSLRLKVVAEGVDAEEQAKMLRLLRCDQMQGYLFSKPLPLEDLAALLQRHGK